MEIIIAVILAMLAGLMNGSYAFPVKYIKRTWPPEFIWFVFSILTFLIMPWIVNLLINPHASTFISLLPTHIIWLEIICGIIFGLGMVLFTFSLNYIGIGISFLLNIGTGTVIATLLPILVKNIDAFKTVFGLLELLAMCIFVIGMISAITASTLRQELTLNFKHNAKGIVFGILSGVLTSGQGFAYAYALPYILQAAHQQTYSPLSAANISWILLFNGAFIPYGIFFLIKSLQQKTFKSFPTKTLQNFAWLILMSILYFVCLILFSKSTLLVGYAGGVISWPLFMIFIILTSNGWGIIQGEWNQVNHKAKFFLVLSVVLMILAVLVLAYNGYLHP